jgi:hypothetical protein
MGNLLSEVPQKMAETQKVNALAQRELMMAMQLAKLRDDFSWMCRLHGTLATVLTVGFLKTHKPQLLIPFVPLGFSLAYTYDAAYGTKIERMVEEAERILATERARFQVPLGNRLVSPEEYAVKIIAGSLESAPRTPSA